MRVALKCHIKILLRSNDPGGTTPVSGVLDALARETVKCWKCCMLGHFARDCPKELGAVAQRGAGLNVLGVQGASQEHNTLIAALQNKVSIQHQLLAAHATITQQDEMLTSALGALGAPLSRRGNHASGRWRIHAFGAVDSAARGGASAK